MSIPNVQLPLHATKKPSTRDRAIDIIRAYCIISMVTAHLAGQSIFSAVMHVFPNFDGASGFVLLSGLVLGMVQNRRVELDGMKAVQQKSFRRLVVVYSAQTTLVALGVAAAFHGWKSFNFPNMRELSVGDVIAHSLGMTLAPPGGDVLRLYVFMLALAMGAYILLARGRWVVVLSISLVFHVVGQIFPWFTSFSPFAEQARSAGWAGWQFLFISALVLGWYWTELGAQSWLDRHALKVAAVCASVMAISVLVGFVVSAEVDEALFSKYTFPVGRIAVAYAVVAGLYVSLRWLMPKVPQRLFRPLVMIGSRSLDSYIIQAIVVVLVYGYNVVDSGSLLAQIIALATLIGCWLWAELRGWSSKRNHAATFLK